MTNSNESRSSADPYNLSRFVQAQADDYEQALSEIRSGKKRTHWMWYIFPQIDGLALSSTSKRYSIKSVGSCTCSMRINRSSLSGVDKASRKRRISP